MIRKIVGIAALGAATFIGACASGGSSQGAQSTAATPSQSRGERGQRGERGGRDQLLLRGIQLSADQQQRVDAIRAKYREQLSAQRRQSGGDRSAARGQMRELMTRQSAEIRALLTPDQQAQFDKNVAELQSRMRQRGGRQG